MDITKPNGQMEELTLVYPTDRHPSPWHCQSGSEEERGVQKKKPKILISPSPVVDPAR